MLQNQTAVCNQTGSPIDGHSIIQQILIFKYHSCLVNYRHELTFERYCSWLFAKPRNSQRRINIDSLLRDREHLQSYNSIEQTMRKIYFLIKGQASKSNFAPILTLNIEQNMFVKNIKRRYQTGLMPLPQSNTMPTEQSQNKERCKDIQIERVISSYLKNSLQENTFRHQDVSSLMLNKVVKDLNIMIKNAYVFQSRQKDLDIKFSKYFQQKYKASRKKELKKIFTETNISAIRQNQYPASNVYYNFEEEDCPQQNYGLKKLKRKNSKTQVKKKTKKLKQQQRSCQKRKNTSQTKKRQPKLSLSPMTPKPIQISKTNWGWGQGQVKNSRSSFKFPINKSNKKMTKQKQTKSPRPQVTKNLRVVKSPTMKRL